MATVIVQENRPSTLEITTCVASCPGIASSIDIIPSTEGQIGVIITEQGIPGPPGPEGPQGQPGPPGTGEKETQETRVHRDRREQACNA